MTDQAAPELNKRDIRRRRSLVGQTLLSLFGKTGALIGGLWIGITAIVAVFAPLIANSRPLIWSVNDPDGLGVGIRFPAFEAFTPQDVWFLAGFLLALGCLAAYRAGGKVVWIWFAVMCAVVAGSMAFVLIGDHTDVFSSIEREQKRFLERPSDANANALSSARWSYAFWWMRWLTAAAIAAAVFAISIAKLRKHAYALITTLVLCVVAFSLLLTPTLRIAPSQNSAVADRSFREAIRDGRADWALLAPIPYSPNDELKDITTTDIAKLQAGVNGNFKSPGKHPIEKDIANEMKKQAEDIYGIRLYALRDAKDQPIPIPRTRADARGAVDLLWEAHVESDLYNVDRSASTRKQIDALLTEYDTLEAGSRLHLMGTTGGGKDVASRVVHGSRIALYIGFISTGIAVVIGVIVGGILGYFGGWVDMLGLRLVEIFAAIPVIMLLIMIVAFYGRSLVLMMVVIGLTGWVGYAYFVRAEFLKLRKMDYVMAARASGTPLHLILFKHMLPNGVAPVLVAASFGVASGIMTEATLSFIGLGLEPSEASWGQMLDEARKSGSFSWWLAIFPGSAIFLTVFAYNLIGEALRDVIDPRTAK